MAELGDKVSGQPRESFRLCVPRIPWESNTNSSGNPTLLCAHEHEHALIGWRHERSPVFRIRRAARTKHETRSTASRALLLFRRTKNRNVLYSRLDYFQYGLEYYIDFLCANVIMKKCKDKFFIKILFYSGISLSAILPLKETRKTPGTVFVLIKCLYFFLDGHLTFILTYLVSLVINILVA